MAPPSPLLAVPNVTAHSSTAIVPTSCYLDVALLPVPKRTVLTVETDDQDEASKDD